MLMALVGFEMLRVFLVDTAAAPSLMGPSMRFLRWILHCFRTKFKKCIRMRGGHVTNLRPFSDHFHTYNTYLNFVFSVSYNMARGAGVL